MPTPCQKNPDLCNANNTAAITGSTAFTSLQEVYKGFVVNHALYELTA